MSLHPTPYFERRLLDLRALSPATVDLAERIASDLKPEVLSTSSDTLEAQLMDHLQEVAQQQARCVTRLWDWRRGHRWSTTATRGGSVRM